MFLLRRFIRFIRTGNQTYLILPDQCHIICDRRNLPDFFFKGVRDGRPWREMGLTSFNVISEEGHQEDIMPFLYP